mmetsp:Transcript_9627/g.22111  ORF Transcript_9627/g.22111 Transcript_9627/m.22111 type:complete len:446 (+) Transcript_9627:3-1340(+)
MTSAASAMMLVPLLVLLVAGLPAVQGTAESNLIVTRGIGAVGAESMDFRGQFGSLSYFVGGPGTAEVLQGRGLGVVEVVHTSTNALWVIEVENSTCVGQILASGPALKHAGVFVVFSSSTDLQIVVLGGERVSESAWPGCIKNVISMPRAALHPQAVGAVGNFLPDDRVKSLIASVNKENLKKTVTSLSTRFFTRMSTTSGASRAQRWLEKQYRAIPGLTVTTFPFQKDMSANVIAELKGAGKPEKVVIVSAHYDSRSTNITDPAMRAPGADDNGSGSSAVLEMARVVAASGLKFMYTIRFCAWSGEEQGLVGSRAYAKKLKEDNADIVAVFNGDMLAYRAPGTPLTVGMKDRFVTESLLQAVNVLTMLYVPELQVSLSASCCSDHQSFFEQGFPAVGYFESSGGASDYPHYHKSTDTVDKLDFTLHQAICRSMLAAVGTFAIPV